MKAKNTKGMTIGTLAKDAGVGVETVRFYERRGLLKRPTKSGSAFRYYSEDDSRKISFIKRAQDLGFTLNEIKDILAMQINAKATCNDLQMKADVKIKEIELKIKDLKRMKQSLQTFAGACGTSNMSIQECGILECFKNDWKC